MAQLNRNRKRVAGVLCALLLTLFFESSLCASVHLMSHAATEGGCEQTHLHNRDCDVAGGTTPCRDDCHFDHRHEQLVAASSKGSSNTLELVLPPSSLLSAFALLDAPSYSASPATLALPPPELRRSTVLLI